MMGFKEAIAQLLHI